jgi:KAP family P-loop domain
MDGTRSRSIVLILDACYSGAFARGLRAKAGPTVDLMDRFEGRGRVILTSSNTMEYAFEGSELSEFGSGSSVFTNAIIRGLETGEADQDADGYITVDELYYYVYKKTRETTPNQTPVRYAYDVQGSIIIAKAFRGSKRLDAELPDISADFKDGAQEVPTPLLLPGPEFNISTRVVSDLPSPVDRLGFRPLIDGLQKLLNDPATILPLAIAITAPWGGGKSSMMLQLRNQLQGQNKGEFSRQWYTVDLPAWKYENSEKLWAALAKAVYEQPQRQLSRLQRIRFKVRLEKARQGLPSFAVKSFGPPLVAFVVLLIAIFGDLAGSIGRSASVLGSLALVLASATATIGHYWGNYRRPI